MNKTRWGVVGTGYIANEFAKGMSVVQDGQIEAVVSRKQEHGEAYAKKFGISGVFSDYSQMLAEVHPDIVYVAVPNDCHYTYIMEALEAGVPVLSEKPMADNRKQFNAIMELASDRKLFVHEGMWTRCFPAVKQARKWIGDGYIGRPLTVRASFDIHPSMEDWQPWKGGIAHAGGSLRDVGIYSLAMAQMVFPGRPSHVWSAMKSNGEVDECCRLLMDYGDGRTAMAGGAFNQEGDAKTEIVGEKGRILIGPEFWHPSEADLFLDDGKCIRFSDPYPQTGFQYEIQTVQQCLRDGRTECAEYTHEEMRQMAELIEEIRKSWGIIYSADKTD